MRALWLTLWMTGCATEVPLPEPTVVEPAPVKKKARTSKPAAKACLPPPTGEGLGDEGVASSRGLGYAAIRATMDGFVSETLACVPAGTTPVGTVATEITVACTGEVSRVVVTDDGGLPEPMVGCVRDVLYKASFPAHDLPDGETFGYPVTFRF